MKKWILAFCLFLLTPIIFLSFMVGNENNYLSSNNTFNGQFTPDLPIDLNIKGVGNFPDSVAQMSVGTAIKYRLLPSIVMSQWAYESAWGTSAPAVQDNNFFGITWFTNCGFNQGMQRGVGGSEGGHYMNFPSPVVCFSYYGYMIAKQPNFNTAVGKTSPSEVLLILGRGGYAAAGINESSPYFTDCLQIIESNQLTSYDDYAIQRWGNETSSTSKGNSAVLESQLGSSLNGGECYGLTAYYVSQLGGPQLMGSGFINACDIGQDYHWSTYGYEVLSNPSFSEVKDGDIVNFKAGYGFSIPYGHTGIAISSTDTSVTVYDQWNGQGVTTSTYSRPLSSIVRKVR